MIVLSRSKETPQLIVKPCSTEPRGRGHVTMDNNDISTESVVIFIIVLCDGLYVREAYK